jgi:hypothetical protein
MINEYELATAFKREHEIPTDKDKLIADVALFCQLKLNDQSAQLHEEYRALVYEGERLHLNAQKKSMSFIEKLKVKCTKRKAIERIIETILKNNLKKKIQGRL